MSRSSASVRSTPSRAATLARSFQCSVACGIVHGAVVFGVSRQGVSLCSFDLLVVNEQGRHIVPVTLRDVEAPALATGDLVAVRGHVTKRFSRSGAATIARCSIEAVEVLLAPRPPALRRLVERACA